MPSPSILLLHLGFALLLGAMFTANPRTRGLIVAAALVLGLQAFHYKTGWLTLGWMIAIVVTGAVQFLIALAEDGRARFSTEDAAMRASLLGGVSASAARHLIDQGDWISGEPGEVLTREGEASPHLIYLFSGEARVTVSGRPVALCRAGDLIGEASALSGEAATATVMLTTPARFWCADAAALRDYIAANEEVRSALGRNFSHALRVKLQETSRALALATAG